MGITSFQVCMDSSNWLQEEGSELDSSSGDIFTCSSPLIERKLRPQHDQPLKCPRCNSTHTKFCYYNNYSLSQPRYFCRSCRRYWTKGGILRNIPVGGGCRKNKKVSSKKSNIVTHQTTNYHNTGSSSSSISNYPETAFSHFSNFIGNINNPSFMLENNPARTDFMESKYEALVGTTSRNQDFIGNVVATGMINGYGETDGLLCSTFGLPMDGTINYEGEDIIMDVKPNPMIEWHDQVQGCSNAGNKESFGYLSGGLESWTGLMTTTNPLV